MTALLSAKLIVSTRDGSVGYLEQNVHAGLAPRVFRMIAGSDYLEHCSLEAFNIDGARARFYGTNYKICEMEVG